MRVGATLRTAARGFRAPPGARLRFLEELRGDLEDLQATLRAAGATEEEAKRRAEALLAPDAEVLEALSRVHRPLWVRWRERAPVRGGRAAGAVLCALALAGVFGALREAATLGHATLFLVPLAGIAAAAAVRTVAKAVRIWVVGESEPGRVREGSADLLVAAAGAAAATVLGSAFELYRTAARISTAPALELTLVTDFLRRTVVLGAAGIGVAMACSLAWLFFVRQAAVLEKRERALLGPELRIDGSAGGALRPDGRKA